MKDPAFVILTVAVAAVLFVGGAYVRSFEREIRAEAVRQAEEDERLFLKFLGSVAEHESLASRDSALEARISRCERLLDMAYRERTVSPVVSVPPFEESSK